MNARLPALGWGGAVIVVAGVTFVALLLTTEPTPMDWWRKRKQ